MKEIKQHIQIPLTFFNETDFLEIYPENKAILFEITEDEANENGESIFQILEGNSYEYAFTNKKFRLNGSSVVSQSKREPSFGRIVPNIYVGTLTLFVTDITQEDKELTITIEVLATKFDTELDKSYRENYRFMLKDITDKCTELLMQINSPVEQNFETDFSRDNETIYQRFSFINAIIQNKDFEEAVLKIIASPKTNWDTEEEVLDIRRIRRFNNAATKQITSGSNRIPFQASHPLYKAGIKSIPNKINSFRKIEHTDTPENRFIKYALEFFLRFAEDCQKHFKDRVYTRPTIEASNLVSKLDGYLSQSFFKDISRPTSLKLNSPVLQRKSGYREILSTWLQFNLAAKLIWKGGENVYGVGKKDIATLYEYWIFFKLLELFKHLFAINPKDLSELIKPTKDGLNLQIKQGTFTALKGLYDSENMSRKLEIQFNYNRTFSGKKEYPDSGSWTTTLRPDYTLSFWPYGISESEAEKQELIVHIHFDAKYKIANLRSILPNSEIKEDLGEISEFEIDGCSWNEISQILESRGLIKINKKGKAKLISLFWEESNRIEGLTEDQFLELVENIQQGFLNDEKKENLKGNYKNADLLKMHAYKDAIRRTGGAYVLYPGVKSINRKGFHEIIPGLGAFPVYPSKNDNGVDDNGIKELKTFIQEIIKHFVNRATQREKLAYRTFDIYKTPPDNIKIVNERLPEPYNENRSLIPDDTFVLVAYYKKENWDWILKTGLFNTRAGSTRGSLKLGPHETGAKYILLHSSGEKQTGKLFKVREIGPRIFSRKTLERINYPKDAKKQGQYYLVYKVAEVKDEEFLNLNWDITKLDGYRKGRGSSLPFSATMTELMNSKNK